MEININLFEEKLEKVVIDYIRKKYKMNFYEFIDNINQELYKMKSNFILRSERDEENSTYKTILQYYNKDLKTICEIWINTDIYNCIWRDEENEREDWWNTHIIAIEISRLIEKMNEHKEQIKNMIATKKMLKSLIVKNFKDMYC